MAANANADKNNVYENACTTIFFASAVLFLAFAAVKLGRTLAAIP